MEKEIRIDNDVVLFVNKKRRYIRIELSGKTNFGLFPRDKSWMQLTFKHWGAIMAAFKEVLDGTRD